ncbi:MAG: hypothetical protein ACPGVB_05925 [Chitinophagales bacterium]
MLLFFWDIGTYTVPINFEKKAIPSYVANISFLHQIGKRFEMEYTLQASKNQKIENTRKKFYYLASTGRVNQRGVGLQLNLSFKYAIFKP